jgi:hypothetical protein
LTGGGSTASGPGSRGSTSSSSGGQTCSPVNVSSYEGDFYHRQQQQQQQQQDNLLKAR